MLRHSQLSHLLDMYAISIHFHKYQTGNKMHQNAEFKASVSSLHSGEKYFVREVSR